MTLSENIKTELQDLARRYDLEKLILFGSRALGNCHERSDIDLAAAFASKRDYLDFLEDVEQIPTLLMFDVVNLSSDMISLDVRKSIMDEGIIIYEKV